MAWLRGRASHGGLPRGRTLFCARGRSRLPAASHRFSPSVRSSGLKIQPTSRSSPGPRIPGADPAGAAHAPRVLLRDHARPAPPGAALLLSERCGRGRAARRDRGGAARRGWGWRPADVRVPAVTGPAAAPRGELRSLFRKCYAGCRRKAEWSNPGGCPPGRASGQARGSDRAISACSWRLLALASASG